MTDHRICVRCIMDTSAPNIEFDESGRCTFCNNFDERIEPAWNQGRDGGAELQRLADQIKADRNGNDFDCIIGLSGGLDSSYTAHVAVTQMGLRPLLLHVDAGWNTDQAVANIERLIDGLGVDLYTEVVNWEEMKDLQLAFLRSQIPDQDIPQDAAFFSALYQFAHRHGVKHILTGSNFSTECCREPEAWGGYLGTDTRLIGDIHKRFGTRELKTFPLIDILTHRIVYKLMRGMTRHYPLNLVSFVKEEAEAELAERYGWEPFLHKHHESRFTRFFEDYWLPRKFGFEKRRAHFSSLIMTGQLEREDALKRISSPELDELTLTNEFEYVAAKLEIEPAELQTLFDGENRTYRDYRNKRAVIRSGGEILSRFGREHRLFQ